MQIRTITHEFNVGKDGEDAPCGKTTNRFWLLYFNYEKHFYFLFTKLVKGKECSSKSEK